MTTDGHWARYHTLAYIRSLGDIICELIAPALERPGAAKAIWVLAQSALAEAAKFNAAFPQEKPIGPDDFPWVVELKAELIKQFGRTALEVPE